MEAADSFVVTCLSATQIPLHFVLVMIYCTAIFPFPWSLIVFFHDRVPSVAALDSIEINTVLAYDIQMTTLQLCAIILTNDLALNVQERAFIQVSQ